uniref:Uncharacterized protein n=1 Tax=Rhizophora mucronata TaxID=61149 RepID=A0A2P2PEJ7_RHIMU
MMMWDQGSSIFNILPLFRLNQFGQPAFNTQMDRCRELTFTFQGFYASMSSLLKKSIILSHHTIVSTL